MTRLVDISGPETGTVRRQHLIAQHDIAFLIQTELKLRIRNDDTAASGIISTFCIKRNGIVAKFGSILLAFTRIIFLQMLDALLVGNILIMIPDLRLGGRGVDRLRQLV